MPFLTHDAPAYASRGKYASAGDEVKLISDRGNVMIVEDGKGNRFPVSKDILSNEPVEEKPACDLKPIVNQVQDRSVKRSKPAPLNSQKTLF